MYMIVALVYVLVAGVAVDEPLVFKSKIAFNGLEKCQDALKDPEFAKARAMLSLLVLRNLPALEDTTVVRDTAVTASCVEDTRL